MRWLARNADAASLTLCMAAPFAFPSSSPACTAEGYGPTATQALPSSVGRANGPDQDGTMGPKQAAVPGAEERKRHQVRRGSGSPGISHRPGGLAAASLPGNGKETMAPHQRERHGHSEAGPDGG